MLLATIPEIDFDEEEKKETEVNGLPEESLKAFFGGDINVRKA